MDWSARAAAVRVSGVGVWPSATAVVGVWTMSAAEDVVAPARRTRTWRGRAYERLVEVEEVLQCCDGIGRPGSAEARLLLSGLRAPRVRRGVNLPSGSVHHRWYYHLTGLPWSGDWTDWRRATMARRDEARPDGRRRSGCDGRGRGCARGRGEGTDVGLTHSGTMNARLRGALDTLDREGVAPGSELARVRLRGICARFNARQIGDRTSLAHRWHLMVTGEPPAGDAVGFARARRMERVWRARNVVPGGSEVEEGGDGGSGDDMSISSRAPSFVGWSDDDGSGRGSWHASDDGDERGVEGELSSGSEGRVGTGGAGDAGALQAGSAVFAGASSGDGGSLGDGGGTWMRLSEHAMPMQLGVPFWNGGYMYDGTSIVPRGVNVADTVSWLLCPIIADAACMQELYPLHVAPRPTVDDAVWAAAGPAMRLFSYDRLVQMVRMVLRRRGWTREYVASCMDMQAHWSAAVQQELMRDAGMLRVPHVSAAEASLLCCGPDALRSMVAQVAVSMSRARGAQAARACGPVGGSSNGGGRGSPNSSGGSAGEGGDESICSICHDMSLAEAIRNQTRAVISGCRHWFCRDCLVRWMQSRERGRAPCPLCRREIRTVETADTSAIPQQYLEGGEEDDQGMDGGVTGDDEAGSGSEGEDGGGEGEGIGDPLEDDGHGAEDAVLEGQASLERARTLLDAGEPLEVVQSHLLRLEWPTLPRGGGELRVRVEPAVYDRMRQLYEMWNEHHVEWDGARASYRVVLNQYRWHRDRRAAARRRRRHTAAVTAGADGGRVMRAVPVYTHNCMRNAQAMLAGNVYADRRRGEWTGVQLLYTFPPLAVHEDDTGGLACCYCAAELFEGEAVAVRDGPGSGYRGRHCCDNGQVLLQPVTNPTGRLAELYRSAWLTRDRPAAGTPGWALRMSPRVVNSALALASQVVRRREMPRRGMQAYVINMRIAHLMGPLRPNEGQAPRFAQLYLFDPETNGMNDEDTTQADLPEVTSHRQRQLNQWFRRARAEGGAAPSRNARRVLLQLVDDLETMFHEVNPYVRDFRTAANVLSSLPLESQQGVQLVLDRDARPSAVGNAGAVHHTRVYDARTAYRGRALQPHLFREVAMLADPAGITSSDFCLQARGGGLQQLPFLHRSFDPLYFVLLFPYGDNGWHSELYRVAPHTVAGRDTWGNPNLMTHAARPRVSALQFYGHRLHWRRGRDYEGGRCVLSGGRLLQEYVCTAYARVEGNNLNYHRQRQSFYRTSTLHALRQEVQTARVEQRPVGQCGQPTYLPSSFTGGVRDMSNRFQDAMAIVRELGRPSLFITMTCNPKWPEIVQSLPYGSKAEDHPEIVARVFNLKLNELMDDLTKRHVLGRTIGHMMVVEFQYRGLPHAHILLIMAPGDRISTADMVDQVSVAELPPRNTPGNERLRALVMEHMVHNDCTNDATCRCRVNGVCRWKFPKLFSTSTAWSDDSIYPLPRRRQGYEYEGTDRTGRTVDSRWIAPYNPMLLLKYECHMNVEVCSSVMAVKYLYKVACNFSNAAFAMFPVPTAYPPPLVSSVEPAGLQYIYKGPDQASVRAQGVWNRDEIAVFESMRYFGAAESCWRLFSFGLFSRSPAVVRLHLELEEDARVTYRAGAEAQAAAQEARASMLTAWLEFCRRPQHSPNRPLPQGWQALTYLQFPRHFIYEPGADRWQPSPARSNRQDPPVGRLPPVSLQQNEEKFYLRLLLTNITCEEVQQLVTVPVGVHQLRGTHETFKEACVQRGLAADDREWEYALAEAREVGMPGAIFELFLFIVAHNSPMDPIQLFESNWDAMYDSRAEQYAALPLHAQRLGVRVTVLQRLVVRREMADALEGLLGHTAQLRLPAVTDEEQDLLEGMQAISNEPRLMRAARAYDRDVEQAAFDAKAARIEEQPSQRAALNRIRQAYVGQESGAFFLDAPAGSGKTYVLQCIMHMVRASGDIVIVVSTTGITALELAGGSTLHSLLKAPLKVTADSKLAIDYQSVLGRLVRQAKLMVYEEAAMHPCFMLDAIDRTFRDLRSDPQDPWSTNAELPFGGLLIIMAGDLCAGRISNRVPAACSI